MPAPSHLTPAAYADMVDASWQIGPTYWQAACDEMFGTAVPPIEPCLAPVVGPVPAGLSAVAEPHTVRGFARVWSYDRTDTPDAPTFVIVAPNSGTAVKQMSGAVGAFGAHGHVRLIEQRDPHYVHHSLTNGLDHATRALVDVLTANPDSHVISFSQSGIPATVATAWMHQNTRLRAVAPGSLTVIGSPINTELAPDTLNWMSKQPGIEPHFIQVGLVYEGAWRQILPGTIPKLYFEKAPPEARATMTPQALPAEHIEDTLRRVFREHWLSRGIYRFGDDRIDTQAITCPVITVAGEQDRICPPAQTHDLHRLTPHAAEHIRGTLPGLGHYALVAQDILARHVVEPVLQASRRPIQARQLAA